MSTDADYVRSCRKSRGLDTFAHKPKYTLTLLLPIITPKGYPLKLETIGEHIRKKEIDLELLQQDVAKIIGVSEQTQEQSAKGILSIGV